MELYAIPACRDITGMKVLVNAKRYHAQQVIPGMKFPINVNAVLLTATIVIPLIAQSALSVPKASSQMVLLPANAE